MIWRKNSLRRYTRVITTITRKRNAAAATIITIMTGKRNVSAAIPTTTTITTITMMGKKGASAAAAIPTTTMIITAIITMMRTRCLRVGGWRRIVRSAVQSWKSSFMTWHTAKNTVRCCVRRACCRVKTESGFTLILYRRRRKSAQERRPIRVSFVSLARI